jgi:hypothetical protein
VLGGKSQRLLPVGEMKVLGHFIDERGCFDVREIEDGKGIDPVAKRRNEEDTFVFEVLLDFCETVLGTGANCCCHNLFFKVCKYNMDTNFKKFNKSTNFFYFATIFFCLSRFLIAKIISP